MPNSHHIVHREYNQAQKQGIIHKQNKAQTYSSYYYLLGNLVTEIYGNEKHATSSMPRRSFYKIREDTIEKGVQYRWKSRMLKTLSPLGEDLLLAFLVVPLTFLIGEEAQQQCGWTTTEGLLRRTRKEI
jgi:hypothetical protein